MRSRLKPYATCSMREFQRAKGENWMARLRGVPSSVRSRATGGACNSACCEACVTFGVAQKFRKKGMAILKATGGTVQKLLFTAPLLKRHSKEAKKIVLFFRSAKKVHDRLQKLPKTRNFIYGGVLFTQYNRIKPENEILLQPHIHVYLLIDSSQQRRTLQIARNLARRAGLKLESPPPVGRASNMIWTLRYFEKKGALQIGTENDRLDGIGDIPTRRDDLSPRKWHTTVFNHAQQTLGKMALLINRFGALSGQGARIFQQRLAYERLSFTEKKQLAQVPMPIPAALNVKPILCCPSCGIMDLRFPGHARRNGVQHRYRCRACSHTFSNPLPPLLNNDRSKKNSLSLGEIRRIRVLRNKKLSIRKIAAKTGHTQRTVGKYVSKK